MNNASDQNGKKSESAREGEVIKREDAAFPAPTERAGASNIFVGTINLFAAPWRRRRQKFYDSSKFHLVADIVLAIVVICLAGSVAWAFLRPLPQNIRLETVLASEKIIGGQGAVFEIAYANDELEAISGVTLSVRLPENFILKSVSPENSFRASSNSFDLGELPAGANGSVALSGIIFGGTGNSQKIISSLNYRLNGRKENFMDRLEYKIDESSLKLALEAPDRSDSLSDIPVKAVLKNNGSIDLENLRLTPNENWTIEEADRQSADGTVSLDKLAAGAEVSLELLAKSSLEGDQPLILTMFSVKGKDKIVLAEARQTITIKVSKLLISLAGSEKNSCAEEQSFALKLVNGEDFELKDLRVIFASGNGNFRLTGLRTDGSIKSALADDNGLTLPDLPAGKTIDLGLKANFSKLKPVTDQAVWLVATARYSLDGEKSERLARSPKYKVASESVFTASGYYYSPQGDQLGIGPVPPTVDIPTTYWIFWRLDNLGNDLTDVSMSADLPDNVYLTGNKSLLAGSLYNGPLSKRVVWSLDTAKKEGGEYSAKFEIGVVPKLSDIGKTLELLNNIEFESTDVFCSKKISGKLKDINTGLDTDRLLKGRGRVVD